MMTEIITVTNQSGSIITLDFDASNAIEDAQAVALRIPASLSNPSRGQTTFTIRIDAYKAAYPTLSHFFARIEQVGKQQIRSWIRTPRICLSCLRRTSLTFGQLASRVILLKTKITILQHDKRRYLPLSAGAGDELLACVLPAQKSH